MNERYKEITRKYARLRNRKPVLCGPCRDELDAGVSLWRKRKVIYDGVSNVMRAKHELEQLWGVKLYFYVCPRSKRRHHLHLTRAPQDARVQRELSDLHKLKAKESGSQS